MNDLSSLCNCKDGFYSVPNKFLCETCHFTCKLCSGPGANNCLYCRTENKRIIANNG